MAEDANDLSAQIIGAAMEVHRTLGPGLLEAAYEECLCHEFGLRGIPYARQCVLPMEYKGIRIDSGFRIDILVDNVLVVELKACEAITQVHKAQLLTYMKFGGWKLGLLINFNTIMLKDGIKRMIL